MSKSRIKSVFWVKVAQNEEKSFDKRQSWGIRNFRSKAASAFTVMALATGRYRIIPIFFECLHVNFEKEQASRYFRWIEVWRVSSNHQKDGEVEAKDRTTCPFFWATPALYSDFKVDMWPIHWPLTANSVFRRMDLAQSLLTSNCAIRFPWSMTERLSGATWLDSLVLPYSLCWSRWIPSGWHCCQEIKFCASTARNFFYSISMMRRSIPLCISHRLLQLSLKYHWLGTQSHGLIFFAHFCINTIWGVRRYDTIPEWCLSSWNKACLSLANSESSRPSRCMYQLVQTCLGLLLARNYYTAIRLVWGLPLWFNYWKKRIPRLHWTFLVKSPFWWSKWPHSTSVSETKKALLLSIDM